MLNLLALLENTDWSINPLDYGPLAGIIAVIFIFLSKLNTIVDYAKYKDKQIENISSQTTNALSEVGSSLHKLKESLDSQKYLFEKIVTEVLTRNLENIKNQDEFAHNQIKDLLEEIKELISKSS